MVFLFALALGGGTHSGFYGDVAVQLLSIPLLIAALWPAFGQECARRKQARLALKLFCGAGLITILQIFPLPFGVWTGTSGLFPEAGMAGTDSHPLAVRTLSLAPEATWAAAASLLVPLAVFGSVLQLNLAQRRVLCWLLLGFGGASLLLGFLQMAQ
ncbi:MAG: hypothetical protein HY765_06365, partial [Rhodomicrobium sp.]|nr:hypothetical protein [Rhodomicrobium sp.]